MAVVLLANVFFWGGGNCLNLGVVNVRILGVVNVRLANNLTPKKHICRSRNNILVENLPPSFHRLYHPSVFRFTAYIVIPMWPEGDPTSVPMQVHNMHLLNNDMHIFIGQSQHLVKLPHFHHYPQRAWQR